MLSKHSKRITKKMTNNRRREVRQEQAAAAEEHKIIEEEHPINHDQNDFCCAICLNYIVNATSTKCGHTFCELCLQEYLLFMKTCPLCTENLRKSKCGACLMLDQIIADFIKNHHPEEVGQYERRKAETRDWKERKQVKVFEVGEKLDVRDPNYVWKVGTIKRLKVSHDAQKTRFLVIHYDGWSERYDEEIPETSPRFASLGFYTSRSDIPRYNQKSKNPFLHNKVTLQDGNELLYLLNDDTSSSE